MEEWRGGWPLALAAMVGYSMSTVQASTTGVMMGPIEAEYGWSRTEIYSGASLVSLLALCLATFIGLAIDKLGARRIAIAATILFCGGFALLSTTGDSLWSWWARWLLIGVALAAMPTVWIAPIASHFNVSRGLAVAVALSGSGIGTAIAPVVAHALLVEHGWRGAYIGLGAIWLVLVLPLVLLFFRTGASPKAAGKTHASKPAGELPGLTAREGFRSPSYYKLLFAGFLGTTGGVALILNMVPVLVSTGVTAASAAKVAGLAGVMTIIGRIFGGWLMDRLSAKWIAAVATILGTSLALAMLFVPGSFTAAATGAALYGFAGGAKIGALAYLASRHLGARAFGTLYGSINALTALGVALAPLAANYIYDMTKSYEPVMWAALPVLSLAALLYLALGDYPDFARTDR